MKLVLSVCVILVSGVILTACVSQKAPEAAHTLEPTEKEKVEYLTAQNEALLDVIRSLIPEAFEEVGLYRIRAGDTEAKIAAKHGITLSELSALNPDVDWTRLTVWQVVRVRVVVEE